MARRIKSQSGSGAQKTALLLGAGYCARALIPHLLAQGYQVFATTRKTDDHAALKAMGCIPLIFDGSLNPSLKAALSQADILLSSIPPDNRGDPFLRAVSNGFSPCTKWAGYLSATSVYGDRQGQWCFEDEPPCPATMRGKRRAEAELLWLETGAPVHIFRLAGIYGPEIGGLKRNPFARLKTGKARAIIKDGHIVNRIHVEDIANAIMASIAAPAPVMIYNLADGHPAPPQDVLDRAADLINAPRPPRLGHDAADISDMARTFYAECKRVSNNRAKESLSWQPQYPHYREGLMSILKSENGTPDAVYLSGYIDVAKADLKSVKLALPSHIRLTRQEPDCGDFRVWQDEDISTRFHVFETFTSRAAFARHQNRMKNSEWALITRNAKRHYWTVGL